VAPGSRLRSAMVNLDPNWQEQIETIMPKQKTHKGTKKRFRLSARGKAKHRQAGTSHLQTRMSQKRKRNLRGTSTVDEVMAEKIQEALNGHSY
jgi:large subunit ribosomal protein L35